MKRKNAGSRGAAFRERSMPCHRSRRQERATHVGEPLSWSRIHGRSVALPLPARASCSIVRPASLIKRPLDTPVRLITNVRQRSGLSTYSLFICDFPHALIVLHRRYLLLSLQHDLHASVVSVLFADRLIRAPRPVGQVTMCQRRFGSYGRTKPPAAPSQLLFGVPSLTPEQSLQAGKDGLRRRDNTSQNEADDTSLLQLMLLRL